MRYNRPRNNSGYTAPMDDIELQSIEDAIESFSASAEELRQETRAGGGTPVERRIADTFIDMNLVFRQMNDKLDSVTDELRRIHSTPETVQGAISDYLNSNGRSITSMNERADRAIGAIESLDTRIGKRYEEAVDEAVKRIRQGTFTALGILLLAAILVLAGVWAWTWHEYSFMPWIHDLMATYGVAAIVFWVVLAGVLIGVAIWTAKRTHDALEAARR